MNERDRDLSVERMLRQALRTGAGAEISGPCLDAETLAAWADGGLTATDLAKVETHLSECSLCQSLVATLERTRPATSGRGPWWPPRFGFGWFVPLTAAAAAILLWVALPGNEPGRSSSFMNVQMPSAAAPSPQEPPLAQRREAPVVVREEPLAPAAEKSASLDSFGRVSAATAAPSARTQAADRAAVAPELTSAASVQARARAIASEIMSPDPSFRWRIGAAGVVEHSTDGGSTWEVLPTGVIADLTAGMSPSPSVCWLVGRAGTVLLSTDGRRWQRVTMPEAIDLVAVQASDAWTASVTTADGRTFRTADGGVSWARRPLQEF